jgi:hypothetical protein
MMNKDVKVECLKGRGMGKSVSPIPIFEKQKMGKMSILSQHENE